MSHVMPAVFVGHGNPMNALQENAYTRSWAAIGRRILRPKAILAVSAHWFVSGTMVTAMASPRTIHDFGGFPKQLYEIIYPAPGDPDLAARVAHLLAPTPLVLDQGWGLDHGTWAVLCHIFPKAEVPVIQLSIDKTKPAAYHYELGRRLAPLRDEGVLIVGSGNIVHNLRAYDWGRQRVEPYDWALAFEKRVRSSLVAGEDEPLVAYEALGPDARLSVPTPDHYLPLIYTIATRRTGDTVAFPVEGIDGGSVSMLAVQLG